MQKVQNGIDVFLSEPGINKNARFAIVTNNAAFTADKLLSRLALVKEKFNLVKIFSPEHGISAQGEDGSYQQHLTDVKTNLPIISLYGDRLRPAEEDLDDVDIVLFDIPDVGCRFYTYLWTMTHVMEACAEYQKQLIILDRPNPVSGNLDIAEGPMLDESNCSSFIGRWSIPVRHSCTMSELARYFSNKKVRGPDLRIVEIKNWDRNQVADEFYPTSPAIQNISTALVYPGTGLLEGINVNEGRGSEKPFLQFGSPWINSEELINELGEKRLAGIDVRPISYIPESGIYANEECFGLEISVWAPNDVRPVRTGIDILSSLFERYPDCLEERAYITNANPEGNRHLDKLLGIKNSFELFRSNAAIPVDVAGTWPGEINPYLLY